MIRPLVFVILLLLVVPARAANITTCTFKGNHTGQGSGKVGWVLRWVDIGDFSEYTGPHEDAQGSSMVTGNCDQLTRLCVFNQLFTAGPMDGKWRYWSGTYKVDGQTKAFSGIWGTSPSARNDGGTWTAQVVCTKP